MTGIIDDYLREVEAALRTDAARKRQIVDELRTHLTERAAELQAQEPRLARDELERQVVRDFGDPQDLAVGYGPEGGATVVRASTGDTVLRIGGAVARGTGKALKWGAITCGILLVVGLAVGVWAYYEVKPYADDLIERYTPLQLYTYSESCAPTPCTRHVEGQRFFVDPGARGVYLEVGLHHVGDGEGQGRLHVSVADPSGAVLFNRTFALTPEGHINEEVRFPPTAGTWTVSYSFDDFRGWVDVEVFAGEGRWD